MGPNDASLPCPDCGYDLYSLPEASGQLQCPECGGSTNRLAIQAELARHRWRPSMAVAILWNSVPSALFAYMAWIIAPMIAEQFLHLPWQIKSSSFLARCIFVGFEGIGLLIAIGLFLLSASTLFWRQVHRRWRWFYGVSAIVLLLGVIAGAVIDWWDMGFYYYEPQFIAFVIVTALPIVLFGTGYIGLIRRGWLAIMKRKR